MIQFDDIIFLNWLPQPPTTWWMVRLLDRKFSIFQQGRLCSVFVRFQGVFVGPRSGEVFGNGEKGLRQCPTHFYVFFSKKNYGKVGIQSQPCWIYRRVGWTSTPISGIKTRDWMIESRFSSEDPTANSLISHSFPDMSGMANNLLMVHEDDLVPSWAEFHQELFQELVPRQQHWHLNFCCIQILSKYRYIDIISFHMTHDERRNAKKVPFVKNPSRRIWFSKNACSRVENATHSTPNPILGIVV